MDNVKAHENWHCATPTAFARAHAGVRALCLRHARFRAAAETAATALLMPSHAHAARTLHAPAHARFARRARQPRGAFAPFAMRAALRALAARAALYYGTHLSLSCHYCCCCSRTPYSGMSDQRWGCFIAIVCPATAWQDLLVTTSRSTIAYGNILSTFRPTRGAGGPTFYLLTAHLTMAYTACDSNIHFYGIGVAGHFLDHSLISWV